MEELVNVFGNGFFPVIMCAVLFWYVMQKDAAHKEEISALKEAMKENNTNMVNALNSLKLAVDSLREALNEDRN